MEEHPEPIEMQPKRVPAKECFINEVKGNETRIAIVVSVVSLNRASKNAVVSDGSGEAVLSFESVADMRGIAEGMVLRVIGKPIATKPLTIQVELAQELKGFDAKIFKKVKNLWAKL